MSKITLNKLDHFLVNFIHWSFIILISFLPFVFCWLSDELFEFNKMLFVYAATILIGGAYLARMITNRRIIFQRTVLDWPIVLFLLSQIISTLLSIHPRTSFLGYYTRLNGGLLSTLCYLVLYYAFVNNMDKKSRTNFIFAFFFSGILVSLYAIGEHFGHSFSCFIIKGKFDVSCWIQDVQTRVFASFGQPNWLAAYNVTLIGLGAALIIDQLSLLIPIKNKLAAGLHHLNAKIHLSKFHLLIIILSVYLNFCALIFTRSRSGILAFFAGFTLTVCLYLFSWWRHQQFSRSKIMALALTFAGFLIPSLIWGTQYTPSLFQLVSSASAQADVTKLTPTSSSPSPISLSNSANSSFPANLHPLPEQIPASLKNLDLNITDSADIRKIVWQGALDIWKAHPLFGTGTETFAYSYYNYRPTDHNWTSEWDFLYNKAHNEFLNFAANTGTFGLLAYLSLFGVFAFFVLRYLYQEKTSPLLIGLSSGLLALSLTNFFGFSTVTVQVLLFLYFAFSAHLFSPLFTKKSPLFKAFALPSLPADTNFMPSQKFSFTMLILIVIFLLNKLWAYWRADFNYAQCKNSAGSVSVTQTLTYCQTAISLSQAKEPLYLSDTANFYAQYAVALSQKKPDSTDINLIANESLRLSNLALSENPVHLNLYKTRFQTLNTLSALDSQALTLAQETIDTAIKLSPTDPKLYYFHALLQGKLGNLEACITAINQALDLRPHYLEARLFAAQLATKQENYALAQAHYQFILDYIDGQNTTATQEIAHLATFSAIISPNENN